MGHSRTGKTPKSARPSPLPTPPWPPHLAVDGDCGELAVGVGQRVGSRPAPRHPLVAAAAQVHLACTWGCKRPDCGARRRRMDVLRNEWYMAAAGAGIVRSAIAAAPALCLQCPTCCGAEHHDELPLAALLQHWVDQPRLGVLSAEGWVRVVGQQARPGRLGSAASVRTSSSSSSSPAPRFNVPTSCPACGAACSQLGK